jgi:hypothetical protein
MDTAFEELVASVPEQHWSIVADSIRKPKYRQRMLAVDRQMRSHPDFRPPVASADNYL